MKKTYYFLASMAVLFSMPAMAETLAEKAKETESIKQKKQAELLEQQRAAQEQILEKYGIPPVNAKSPICENGGA